MANKKMKLALLARTGFHCPNVNPYIVFPENAITRCIFLLLLTLMPAAIWAEGSKQLMPANTDSVSLYCNGGSYYNFARYDGTDDQRLYIHIEDSLNELIYLGFRQPHSDTHYPLNSRISGYFRIKSPDGSVVYGPQLINGTTENLTTWQQVQNGPNALRGDGAGYDAFTFDPKSQNLPSGDYYIEFNIDANTYNSGLLLFEYFDITVATKGTSGAAIEGRVYAKNWALMNPSIDKPSSTYSWFDRPFNGAFFVYTNEGYVSRVDFSGSGFQPAAFNISYNSTGTSTTGDIIEDRKSLENTLANTPEYPVFLNDPDPTVYPSGTFGEMLTDSIELIGCATTGYWFKITVTETGLIEILLDQNQGVGSVGIYTPGTADRLLALDVQDQSNDNTPDTLTRYVPWDGLDGLGNTVSVVTPVATNITFSQGIYHIPIYDAEYNLNGFSASIVRPLPPPTYTMGFYYDDSNISEASGTGSPQFDTDGCTPPCHTWNDPDFGNINTINTYWFAKQEFSANSLSPNNDCGTDTDGDGRPDLVDIDVDNDGIPNSYEACGNSLPPANAQITIRIQLDQFSGETSWTLTNSNGSSVANAAYTNANANQLVSSNYTGSIDNYTFTISDAYGDGINSGFGVGYYEILIDGVTVIGGSASGNGSFGASAAETFASLPLFHCTPSMQNPLADNDFDGVPDYKDSDFCTLNTLGICTYMDLDNDGIPAFLDLDSDNDGIPDIVEAGGTDTNNDGQVEYATPGNPATMADSDNDGLVNTFDLGTISSISYPDTDGDGIRDPYDLDSDNDGMADLVESYGVDTNGNGQVDTMTDPGTGDTDDNGWADATEASPLVNQSTTDNTIDFDGDNLANHLDIDSDNDGIIDLIESNGQDNDLNGQADDGTNVFTDSNNDGWEDNYDAGRLSTSADGGDNNSIPDYATGLGNPDYDGDGQPNYLDIDADDDGIVDNTEAQSTIGYTAPNTGGTPDSDGDGLNNNYDTINGFGGPGLDPVNTDGLADGADYVDLDTDQDGETDRIEGHDTNGDGVVNGTDTPVADSGLPIGADADNDGLLGGYDNNDSSIDPTNGNLQGSSHANVDVPASLERDWRELSDLDIDDDGIPNSEEDGATGYDPIADEDGDGLLNYLDDADATVGFPSFTDSNNDGINDAFDTDVDGIPDYIDLDADNDGIPDLVEAGGTDSDNNGITDVLTDTDGDGLVDLYDNNDTDGPTGSGADPSTPSSSVLTDPDMNGTTDGPDTDSDGIYDWVDLDSDNDGIADLVEVGGIDTNGDGKIDSMTNPTTGDTDFNGWADSVEASPLVDQRLSDNAIDFDGDTYPNHLDLDADNDGITDVRESGASDGNNDGLADDGSLAGTRTDSNGDGWEDNYDAGTISTTADGADANTSADFAIGQSNPDYDGDGQPNWLDIDADDDGIVDNTEGQATGSYTAPATGGSPDSDADGLNNNYDNISGFGGSGIDPVNTDNLSDGADYIDLDTDQDGEADLLEGHDSNGDGVVNGTDVGIVSNTGLATGVDSDLDGLDDGFDNNTSSPDPTNTGLQGTSYANADVPGTTERDWRELSDLDADNDGIPDTEEDGATGYNPSGDADGDGILNYLDDNDTSTGFPAFTDSNGDGINDIYDTDQDGFPDFVDLDADNDGIPDIIEAGGTDTDGNGIADDVTDSDGDGLVDLYDNNDTDGPLGDGSDMVNPSSSSLTDPDRNGVAISKDSDNDGLADHLDLDADNDGIPDLVEAGGVDTNGNGRVDNTTDSDSDGYADLHDPTNAVSAGSNEGSPHFTTGADNGDGTPNSACTDCDSDGDLLPDYLDLDADNDGIPDLVEAGGIDTDGNGLVDLNTDTDNDGLADIFDENADDGPGATGTNGTALVETDGSGNLRDGSDNTAIDQDGDGLADHLDLDADDDGIPDIIEAGGFDDDNDGKVSLVAAPWDGDNDGLADVYDSTVGGMALVETTADNGAGTGGVANDGRVNGNETMVGGNANHVNVDGDALANHLDMDSDDDGITDVVENAGGDVTADNSGGVLDGIVGDNASVTDSNIDGWHDPSTTATTDTDGDNIPDYLDMDSDNDGIPDYLEGVCSSGCPTPDGMDSNGNGLNDVFENIYSSNDAAGVNIGVTPHLDDDDTNDSNPDYLDLDTDEDGSYDWSEGFDSDGDGQAQDELVAIAAAYETSNSNPGHYPTTDSDLDGIYDWLDNLTGPGYTEASKPPFLDPSHPGGFWRDANGNGLADLFDNAVGGTTSPIPDNNGGDRDWRDAAAQSFLPVDLMRFDLAVEDCEVALHWMTATEVNFSHFEVEESSNGLRFEKVGQMAASGRLNGDQYVYDLGTVRGLRYYRLKLVDEDGSIHYSAIVTVRTPCANIVKDLKAYPNPLVTTAVLNLELQASPQAIEAWISDQLGRVLYRFEWDLEEGLNRRSIDLQGLPDGIYFLHTLDHKALKFIKQTQSRP